MFTTGDFIMRWRDIRFEKPTEADADELFSEVAFIRADGIKCVRNFQSFDGDDYVAWMPLSELPTFDRVPDPPEGWRFVEKGEPFDNRAKFWFSRRWENTHNLAVFDPHSVYIVPIDPPKPPEPQYRPYNASELKQTIGKLVDGVSGYRAMITGACGDSVYCQGQRVPSDQLLKNHTWTDGGKCGVKVEP
jgi:hypothetical protein